MIEKCYGDKAKKVTRYAFKKEADIFDVDNLKKAVFGMPNGYEPKIIEEAEYNMCRENAWAKVLK